MRLIQSHPQTKHPNQQKEKKLFRSFISLVLVLCIFVGGLCVWYYTKLHSTIREESNEYLQEVTAQIEKNIERIMDDTYAMLYSVDKMLGSEADIPLEILQDISSYQKQYWKFKNILLIDAHGNAYDENGSQVFLLGEPFLQKTLEYKEASISPLQVIGGEEFSVFAVPLDGRKVGEIEAVALAATYDVDVLSQVLSMSAFGNQAYSSIVSTNGTVILSTASEEMSHFGYNILSSIENAHTVSDKDMLQLRENIRSLQNGKMEFSFDGRGEYMVYRPVSSTDWMLLTFIPMEAVNEKSNILLTITLLIAGVIVIAFSILVALLFAIFRSYQRKLEQIAYVDDVTGGNTIQRFFELAGSLLAPPQHPVYALVYTNFSKFKILNENFGRQICDDILRHFYKIIAENLSNDECIGRISADNFCILMRFETVEEARSRFKDWFQQGSAFVQTSNVAWSWPSVEFGVYIVDNDTLPFPQMIDRAKLALRETPRSINSKLWYAVYNDEVRSMLLREKQLEDMMEEALASGEFQMYLQPKYRVKDEKIVGAEALTRWISKSEGMIFPNEFIPLFEKNGFILQLDIWIFKEACRVIRRWIDEGRNPVKISVNCSRVHLKNPNFLTPFKNIAKKYHIPPSFIEIELTENLVLEDSQRFKEVVDEIHEAGFGCSMDDFGSGYSSLNLLQDISVDTLKLDRVFFRNTAKDPVRTESVISNIISMAKALDMETVAEGVEEQYQVSMLRRIGCELIQGYVYAKPMPLAEFETLLYNNGTGGDAS